MAVSARILVFFVLVACGDDAPPAAIAPDAGPRPDVYGEADVPAVDVGGPDVEQLEDGGDSPLACASEIYELVMDPMTRERTVSATVTSRGFAFGWGDTTDVREQARTAEMARDASEPIIRALTNDDRSARSVQVSEGYAIWIDDLGTGSHYVIRGSDTSVTDTQYRTLSEEEGEHRAPLLFQVERGWLAAWLAKDGDTWRIEVRTLSEDGRGEGVRTRLPWALPHPYFSMSLADGQRHFSWNDGGDVMVAVMDDEGGVRTEPTIVSSGAVIPGESSLAFAEGFGVVAYTVLIEGIRREVRARLLGPDGIPTRPEQVVSHAPARGRSPTAAAFAGGYAIAYRGILADGGEHLRLAFVHGSDGNVIDQYELGEVPFEGPSAGVTVDSEGALAVGWASVGGDGTQIFGARLQCASAWLRCGVMR